MCSQVLSSLASFVGRLDIELRRNEYTEIRDPIYSVSAAV